MLSRAHELRDRTPVTSLFNATYNQKIKWWNWQQTAHSRCCFVCLCRHPKIERLTFNVCARTRIKLDRFKRHCVLCSAISLVSLSTVMREQITFHFSIGKFHLCQPKIHCCANIRIGNCSLWCVTFVCLWFNFSPKTNDFQPLSCQRHQAMKTIFLHFCQNEYVRGVDNGSTTFCSFFVAPFEWFRNFIANFVGDLFLSHFIDRIRPLDVWIVFDLVMMRILRFFCHKNIRFDDEILGRRRRIYRNLFLYFRLKCKYNVNSSAKRNNSRDAHVICYEFCVCACVSQAAFIRRMHEKEQRKERIK